MEVFILYWPNQINMPHVYPQVFDNYENAVQTVQAIIEHNDLLVDHFSDESPFTCWVLCKPEGGKRIEPYLFKTTLTEYKP